MKNRLVSMGMLAGLLTFGLLMFGCESNGSGGGGGGSDLVARWYKTQPYADAENYDGFVFEFKADGSGMFRDGTFTYTAEHGQITQTVVGKTTTGTYSVKGTVLTLSWDEEEEYTETYYKKA